MDSCTLGTSGKPTSCGASQRSRIVLGGLAIACALYVAVTCSFVLAFGSVRAGVQLLRGDQLLVDRLEDGESVGQPGGVVVSGFRVTNCTFGIITVVGVAPCCGTKVQEMFPVSLPRGESLTVQLESAIAPSAEDGATGVQRARVYTDASELPTEISDEFVVEVKGRAS